MIYNEDMLRTFYASYAQKVADARKEMGRTAH